MKKSELKALIKEVLSEMDNHRINKINHDKPDDETKSPEMARHLDDLSLKTFGRARSLAKAGKGCVACGGPANDFKDALSKKEYGISGFCQKCQDKVFGED
jgi:hypothetical protein